MADILLCGANEGIGLALAASLLELGHRVAVLDISLSHIGALSERFGGSLLCFQADASSPDAVKAAADSAAAAFGGFDAAVHNACVCPFAPFEESGPGLFDSSYYVNFIGAVNLTHAALPHMRPGGRVAFTSSGVGITGFPNLSAYASTKGALESLAKCLRLEYAGRGISFHILHPPLTRTRSSAPLPVPPEFMAGPETVGRGLARALFSRRFIICHSRLQWLQTIACCLFPLRFGSLLSRLTARAASGS